MLSRLCLFVVSVCVVAGLPAREFTVLVYNVENLFDIDGVAVFEDYRQTGVENPYSPERLLTKVRHIAETLAAVNEGDGPEVVLFQEFELDRTPFSGWRSAQACLEEYAGISLEAMLTSELSNRILGLPAEAFLWKYLNDAGMGPYYVAKSEVPDAEWAPAHNNVVFSRFPIHWVRQRPMASARDLLVVGLEVEGHEFILLNNHWKAGASNPRTEPIRIQNAHVVRAELEAILLENPAADVLLAGDLNSHYNQAAVFPDLAETAVNGVLGSATNETALIAGNAQDLYNLWGELPPAERGSEVYRGYWGTLMQMLVTRGLYDQAGVQYVDNSFFRLILPGRNADARFGTPHEWLPVGGGAGFSDHLPIGARFRTVEEGDTEAFPTPRNPTEEIMPPARLPKVDFAIAAWPEVSAAAELEHLSDNQLAARMGELFEIEAEFVDESRARIRIGKRAFGLYAPPPEVGEALASIPLKAGLHALGQLDSYRGEIQFVIRHASWIRD